MCLQSETHTNTHKPLPQYQAYFPGDCFKSEIHQLYIAQPITYLPRSPLSTATRGDAVSQSSGSSASKLCSTLSFHASNVMKAEKTRAHLHLCSHGHKFIGGQFSKNVLM